MTQPSDPAKLARAVLDVVRSKQPPLRLPLGLDTVAAIEAKNAFVAEELRQWRSVAVSTDFATRRRSTPAASAPLFTRALLTTDIARAILLAMETPRTFSAFAGHKLIGSGDVREVLRQTRAWLDAHGDEAPVLLFEDQTGNQVDFDMRGTADDVVERLSSHPLFAGESEPKRSGPGRPKLGVVSREVSLLPRHWEWLEAQRGGISVALRALVDEARKRGQSRQLARSAREAAGKFMWTMAGNLPDFEEASRALYGKDDAKLRSLTKRWPKDIREHVARLVAEAARLEEIAALEEKRAKASGA